MGASKVGLVDPSNPYKLPPEAATVIGIIRSAEGTAQGKGNVLFGGRSYDPGPDHPADEGWQGSRTSAGPTHAADAGQWQPAAWHDEVRRAKEQGIDLTFNKGADQDWAIMDRAARLYKNATGRDLIEDQRAGKADLHVLGGEWAGLARGTGASLRGRMTGNSPGMNNAIAGLNEAGQAQLSAIDRQRAENAQLVAAEPPGSAKRQKLLDEGNAHVRELERRYNETALHPPIEKPADIWSNFGNPATIVVLIGGLFARRHATAALSAAGAAMQAINQNNHDKFEAAYKTWETQTKTAADIIKMQREDIAAIMHDEDKAWDHKIQLIAQKYHDDGQQNLALQVLHGDATTVYNHESRMDSAANQMKNYLVAGQVARERLNLEAGIDKELAAHPDLYQGDPSKIPTDRMAEITNEAAGKSKPAAPSQTRDRAATARAEVSRRDAEWAKAHPDATDDEMQKQHFIHANEVDKTVGAAARQPRNAPAMALQTYIEEQVAKGHTPTAEELQSFAASTAEKTSEGRAVGTRSASLEMASNAADAIIPLLREKANKIDLGRFPDVNSLILAAQQRTGGTDVVQYGELINSMRYLYARALSPTGQARVADLQHFDDIMNKNWSKDQINAGLDQIHQSLMAERGAIAKTREEVRSGGVPVAPASPASAGDLPKVSDPDAYAKVPSGGQYLAPDGKVYTKQ
jgi:hypothetical protein